MAEATKVKCYVLSGLGHSPSNGIIYNLAALLVQIPGVEVWVGSHGNWEWVVQDILRQPADVEIVLLGHSLGGAILPTIARSVGGRQIAAIFGWDPADNIATQGEYNIEAVPENVPLAVAIFIEGGFLGGGWYFREGGTREDPGHGIKNEPVNDNHIEIEQAVRDHLIVVDTTRRLAA